MKKKGNDAKTQSKWNKLFSGNKAKKGKNQQDNRVNSHSDAGATEREPNTINVNAAPQSDDTLADQQNPSAPAALKPQDKCEELTSYNIRPRAATHSAQKQQDEYVVLSDQKTKNQIHDIIQKINAYNPVEGDACKQRNERIEQLLNAVDSNLSCISNDPDQDPFTKKEIEELYRATIKNLNELCDIASGIKWKSYQLRDSKMPLILKENKAYNSYHSSDLAQFAELVQREIALCRTVHYLTKKTPSGLGILIESVQKGIVHIKNQLQHQNSIDNLASSLFSEELSLHLMQDHHKPALKDIGILNNKQATISQISLTLKAMDNCYHVAHLFCEKGGNEVQKISRIEFKIFLQDKNHESSSIIDNLKTLQNLNSNKYSEQHLNERQDAYNKLHVNARSVISLMAGRVVSGDAYVSLTDKYLPAVSIPLWTLILYNKLLISDSMQITAMHPEGEDGLKIMDDFHKYLTSNLLKSDKAAIVKIVKEKDLKSTFHSLISQFKEDYAQILERHEFGEIKDFASFLLSKQSQEMKQCKEQLVRINEYIKNLKQEESIENKKAFTYMLIHAYEAKIKLHEFYLNKDNSKSQELKSECIVLLTSLQVTLSKERGKKVFLIAPNKILKSADLVQSNSFLRMIERISRHNAKSCLQKFGDKKEFFKLLCDVLDRNVATVLSDKDVPISEITQKAIGNTSDYREQGTQALNDAITQTAAMTKRNASTHKLPFFWRVAESILNYTGISYIWTTTRDFCKTCWLRIKAACTFKKNAVDNVMKDFAADAENPQLCYATESMIPYPGNEPSQHKPGNEPSQHKPGNKPSRHEPGNELSRHEPGNELSQHKLGNEPSRHDELLHQNSEQSSDAPWRQRVNHSKDDSSLITTL